MTRDKVSKILSARSGHFLLESGHHGNLWLDLESLCLHPSRVQPLAADLAQRISALGVEAVCGPLVEGAFIALLAASVLDVEFTYSERYAQLTENSLFPAGYRVPLPLREKLRGKRVSIVNDVINAGSAVKGTFADLLKCGAEVVGIASLLVLGTAAGEFAKANNVPLVSLAVLDNSVWKPSECSLCASQIPLEDLGGFAENLASQKAKGQ
jgi:orotate phosphoribosyltransferase